MKKHLIYLLALGSFMVGTVEFIVMGIVDIIARDLNVSVGLAGQLVSVYALSVALGSLVIAFTGKLERKKLLLYALLIFTFGNVLSFFSINFTMLMLSRVLLGLSGGVFTIVSLAAAARLAPLEQRGSAIGTIIMGFSAAQCLGLPLGTLISGYIPWNFLFLFAAILTFVLMIAIRFYLPELEGEEPVSFQMQISALNQKPVWIALSVSFLFVTGFSMFFTFVTPFLQASVGMSTELISLTLLLAGIGSIVGSRFGGYGTDRWGVRMTLLTSLLIHAFLLLMMPVAAAAVITSIALVMLWMTVAQTTIPTQSYYLTTLTPKTADIALSMNTSLFQLGAAAGAGIGGLIVSRFSVGNIGWVAGSVVLIGFLVAAYSFSFTKRSSSIPASGSME